LHVVVHNGIVLGRASESLKKACSVSGWQMWRQNDVILSRRITGREGRRGVYQSGHNEADSLLSPSSTSQSWTIVFIEMLRTVKVLYFSCNNSVMPSQILNLYW